MTKRNQSTKKKTKKKAHRKRNNKPFLAVLMLICFSVSGYLCLKGNKFMRATGLYDSIQRYYDDYNEYPGDHTVGDASGARMTGYRYYGGAVACAIVGGVFLWRLSLVQVEVKASKKK